MTPKEMDVIAGAVVSVMKAVCEPLRKRIETLEARPRGLKYCGTWSDDAPYGPGDVVTDKGSMWTATAATKMRPGESRDWQLAVKAGRDGR